MKHPQYRYFELHEFDSPDKKGSGKNMKSSFLKKLDKARMIAEERYQGKVKFVITWGGGFRTFPYHTSICYKLIAQGKIKKRYESQHELGLAADISAESSREKFAIVECLLAAGFTRIGMAKTFIHVDMGFSGNDNMNRLMWTY